MAGATALTPEQFHEIEERRDPLILEAHALEIRDQTTFEYGAAFLVKVGDLKKAIVAGCDPVKRAAKAAHTAACDQERELLAPVLEAEGVVKGVLGDYQREQARKEREAREAEAEERRKADAEAKRLAEEEQLRTATELEEAGLPDAAERVLAQPPPVVPQAPPPPPRTVAKGAARGVATKKKAHVEVEDLNALIQAVASGEGAANLLQPNMVAIRALARAQGDAFRMPGVRFWTTDEVVRTGR